MTAARVNTQVRGPDEFSAPTRVIIRGHALMQNIRRGHYDVGVDARTPRPVEDAFTELARPI